MTVVTRKGQITLPAEIRRALDLKEGDKVTVSLVGNEARVRPAGSVLEQGFGAVEPRRRPEDFRELRRLAEEAIAEDAVRSLGKE